MKYMRRLGDKQMNLIRTFKQIMMRKKMKEKREQIIKQTKTHADTHTHTHTHTQRDTHPHTQTHPTHRHTLAKRGNGILTLNKSVFRIIESRPPLSGLHLHFCI